MKKVLMDKHWLMTTNIAYACTEKEYFDGVDKLLGTLLHVYN